MSNNINPNTVTLSNPPKHLDYSLTGENSTKAIEKGLAEADWYQCPVPRAEMRKLLERIDGPAVRDTIIWFSLILGFGTATVALWGSWLAVIPYLCYAVLYGSTSDSRWHESSHGTAFRSDWMNNTLYEISSFMIMRESVVWRWSHTRHHSDTIIVGRDPEISVPRPPSLPTIISKFFNIPAYRKYFKTLIIHSFGKMKDDEKTYIPVSEYNKIYRNARIYVGIYVLVIVLAIYMGSILPVMMIGFANFFGAWLMVVYGVTQHAGLAENVLDHRLNCRTFHTNFVHRFLYWNMNYHVEHHMFPLIPYHNLPKMHELIKDDCPDPYPSLLSCWKEIVPAVLKQVKDPAYHIKRKLPEPKQRFADEILKSIYKPDTSGWIEVCESSHLGEEDVIRFDCAKKTFALYRDKEGKLYATDGICTHGNTHLADGLVKEGIVECPKHNGRFNLDDGSPARAPICRGLATYPVEERNGYLWLNIKNAGGYGARKEKSFELKVVSNRNVSTFIKELNLELVDKSEKINAQPGDYMQLDIPVYNEISFREFDIPQPYYDVWEHQHVFDLISSNSVGGRRNNYSLVGNPDQDGFLRFNVRIATPPPGQDCSPGVGSSYLFNLKPGDRLTAIGSFGDFHIKPSHKEMIYIGGGAGMAPLRAHISQLFEIEQTSRKVSYWYGARSKQEIFYADYFEKLETENSNFNFHLALSSPIEEDHWDGNTGLINEVILENYLKDHPSPTTVEYYLCGPPKMIKACTRMLLELGVDSNQIAFDEF